MIVMDKDMSEFSAALKLAHDLKSPLSALKILQARLNLADEADSLLLKVIHQLEGLITEVSPNLRTPLNGRLAWAILRQAVAEQRLIHGDLAITAKADESAVEDAADNLKGSAVALKRCLTNLLQNAAHHAESQVQALFTSNALGVRITVRGDGLEPQERDASQGWGLGLKIVTEICEAQGWALEIGVGDAGLEVSLRINAQ